MSVTAEELKDIDAVRRLVESHQRLERNGELLFALWYNRSNRRGDIYLFEIFEHFPDPGWGRLETYEFSANPDLPIRGHLKLTITSPSELKEAKWRGDRILAAILRWRRRDGVVLVPADGGDTVLDEIVRDNGK